MKNLMKRISALVLAVVVGAAVLCPAALAVSASLPDLPSGQCVVDDANVLNSETKQNITDLNAKLEANCEGAQIGVLTVDYTGNLSTEDYATQAFNTWGIGDASENNGVLILLVMESPIYDGGDYYVTYGDGFRNTTLESQASAIAQTMEDEFAVGNYNNAVNICANNVANTIADIYGVSLDGGSYDDGYADPADDHMTLYDVFVGIIMLFITLLILLIIVMGVFRIFISPIGHALGWYWGPFRWVEPRRPRHPYDPGPPPPHYYDDRRYDDHRPPRNNSRPTPPRSGGSSFGGGGFSSGGSRGGGSSFGGMGGGSSHGGGGGRGR